MYTSTRPPVNSQDLNIDSGVFIFHHDASVAGALATEPSIPTSQGSPANLQLETVMISW